MSKGTLIECKLHRSGGSKVEIGGTEYHFKPDDVGQHVCLIENVDHRDRLLSIPEAYRLPRVDTSANVLTAALGAQPATVLPASSPAAPVPAEIVIPAQTVVTPETEGTGTASDVDSIPGNDGEGGESNSAFVGVKADGAEQAVDLSTLDRDALAEIYHQRLGRKAHPAMKIPKMLEEIKAAAAAAPQIA